MQNKWSLGVIRDYARSPSKKQAQLDARFRKREDKSKVLNKREAERRRSEK